LEDILFFRDDEELFFVTVAIGMSCSSDELEARDGFSGGGL